MPSSIGKYSSSRNKRCYCHIMCNSYVPDCNWNASFHVCQTCYPHLLPFNHTDSEDSENIILDLQSNDDANKDQLTNLEFDLFTTQDKCLDI